MQRKHLAQTFSSLTKGRQTVGSILQAIAELLATATSSSCTATCAITTP